MASAGHSLSRQRALENLIRGGGIAHKAGTGKNRAVGTEEESGRTP